jgi:hypothetical protein
MRALTYDCAYQQQHEEQQQPLPQHELAPGVIATFCMPGSQVDPTCLLNVSHRVAFKG